MKTVSLVHTVPTVYATFGKRVLEAIPDVKITNTVDEFLASDPGQLGRFTPSNKTRLFLILQAAAATGADAIVTTCSTLSPAVTEIRSFFEVPLITIDGAMLRDAVAIGRRIAVVATADSTIAPTTSGLQREATAINKELDITTILCHEAYTAIKARDTQTHDRIVLDRVRELHDSEVVVLAQASMAHLEDQVAAITGCPVLSSPKRCIAELANALTATVSST